MRGATLGTVTGTLVCGLLFALPAPCAEGQDPDAGWRWSITPYMWATDVGEDLSVGGEIVGGDDTDFKDLVDKIDASAQLHFEGSRGRWGMFADLMYTELSDSVTGELGVLRLEANVEEAVLELGAICRPGGAKGKLDVLLGVRGFAIDEDYRLFLGDQQIADPSIDEDYLDALIGVRYGIPLSERWAIALRGDVSFGDTDYVWTAQGLLGWRFGSKRRSAVFVGYRYREMKYDKGDALEVEKTLSGVGLGVSFGF